MNAQALLPGIGRSADDAMVAIERDKPSLEGGQVLSGWNTLMDQLVKIAARSRVL